MINHARTLLLNLSRSDDDTGGEYVPKDFVPIQLSGYMLDMYNTLFPGEQSRESLNLTVRYYTSLMHAAEFRRYLMWFDNRLTYEPSLSDLSDARPRLPEFNVMFRTISNQASRCFDQLVSGQSFDEELRTELVDAYKLVLTDQDKLRVLLYLYILRMEGLRRGRY